MWCGVVCGQQVLLLPLTVRRHGVSGVRLLGDSKFPIGVNVSVNGHLPVSVSLVSGCTLLLALW